MVTLPKISRRLTYVAVLLVPAVAVPVALVAQDVMSLPDAEQKDWLTSFVEGQLSTPERQIRLSNIDGILGSDVTVREITISDQQGVWLRVNNASLNWNQGALFTGKLDVRSLRADSIDYIRNAVPAEGVDLPAPEAGSLEIPEFPVAIQLGELTVPRVTFGEGVFGLGSEISLAGSLTLEGGNLDTDLDITRLDGPGGTLGLDLAYLRADNSIDLALDLNEPANGVIANLLNIEGRPAMQLTLSGAGPVEDLTAELNLLADGQPALAGTARIEQAADGLAIVADIGGPLSRLVAEPYRPFFGAETRLTGNALLRSAGGLDLTAVTLSGGQLSLTASATTTADNFLSQLDLEARIADPAGAPVTLPVAGNATRVGDARFSIDFGEDDGGNWSADLEIERFETDGFAAQQFALGVAGVATNLSDPANRMVTFNGDGELSGIAADPGVKAALGDSVGLGLAGMWQGGQPIQLAQLRIVGEALTASLAGAIDGTAFKGRIGLQTDNISPFSGLADRQLTGGLMLDAEGEIQAVGGAFDLTFDGVGSNLSVDDETADKLLAGQVELGGRLARTENGLIAENFSVTNPQVQFTADGTYASDTADFAIGLDLADLALLSEEASGALKVRGTAKSAAPEAPEAPIALVLDVTVPSGTLVDRTLRDAQIGLDLALLGTDLTGTIDGSAMLDGYRATLASQVAVDDVRQALTGLAFEIAGTRVSGEVSRAVDTELLTGRVEVAAPDVSLAAALLLQEASGAVNARIELAPNNGEQGASVSANAANLRVSDIAIGRAEIAATIGDLFGVPAIDGTIKAGAISVAGTAINVLDAKASQNGDTTSFDGTAALATGTGIAVGGSLSPVDGGYRLALNHANLVQGQLAARLANPTTLMVQGESVVLDAVRFDVGTGRITASGTAGNALDLTVDISALPLSIANAVVPGLGLAGTLEGNARITGSASDPRVTFDARGNGINATAIAPFGIAPLNASARGSFAANTVSIDALSANGAGGLSVTGSGRVPLSGAGLSVTANGSAPLTLTNRFLIDRGGQLSGTANFDAQVSGSLANPQFGGSVSTNGAGYVDPELNLRLANISGRARLDGTTATVEGLSANLSTGGSASISGTVGLTGNFPANLALNVNSARYADGDLFIATVSGNLGLTGNLTGTPLLAGTVLVEQANITVPEGFGGGAELIDVQHRSTPPAVAQTLDRAKITTNGAPVPQSRSPGMLLDITVNAPNQIFIRGRGLDAEVGGTVRLTGPLNNIQPVGAFSLNRGRLSILGQRITFERGTVTLVGDLDPQLDFVATTQADDINVIVSVSGRVSALEINFSSNPQLPQDEVLARLIFKRSMGELSPLQLAQLAAAAGELVGAGGSGGGLLGGLRGAAGLADLDVVTDAQGNVGVEAGTYLQENIYLGVTAGANGQNKVTINLDVTDDLTVKGAAGQDGNSSLGVFYERDY